MTFTDLLVCGVMTVGLAQTFVRADGGPGEWLRTRVADPVLGKFGLGKLSNCTFCASAWFGFAVSILFFTVPEAVYVGAAAFAGPAMLWVVGEVPRRKGMGCNRQSPPTQPETTTVAAAEPTTPGS